MCIEILSWVMEFIIAFEFKHFHSMIIATRYQGEANSLGTGICFTHLEVLPQKL
jgi:hypothetical protein